MAEADNPLLEFMPEVGELLLMEPVTRQDVWVDMVSRFMELIEEAHAMDHAPDGDHDVPHRFSAKTCEAIRRALIYRYASVPEMLVDAIISICVATAFASEGQR